MAPIKILVVDDEIELQRLIEQRFRKKIRAQEVTFLFAPDGLEALQKLKADRQVDMVLTDINMPKMDGLTLIGRLSEIDETLKAVVISAYGDIPNIRKAMNRGAFDFLTKPIDFQDLEVTIQKTLECVHQSREKLYQIQKAQEELFHAAYYDALTGLPNRNWFSECIARLIEQTNQGMDRLYALLFIDLDRFTLINDSLGHAIGDALLVEVAERLKVCLREPDTVVRLGGDEFGILLENVKDSHCAIAVAKRIQELLAQPFNLEGLEIFSEASIGIALGIQNYQRSEELLHDADVAMNWAKAQGKGRYEVFDPIMQIKVRECLQLENDLRKAIDRGELSLHYQPIICSATDLLSSFEALIRWHHSGRSIPPVKFIPLAEETKLIIPLGWWVVRTACEQLRLWQQQCPGHVSPKLNINFSAIQLQQANVVEQMQQILAATGLEGKSLNLEITESYLLENAASSVETLRRLKELGIHLCIDDFGTGYSSLSRLHEFPIDTLKIDRSFIKRMDLNSGKNLETVQMIVTLAHSLGMNVVAEGVETMEQLDRLKQLGCDFIQGYLISRPIDSQSASQFLSQT
ncbi:putative bifunctional diguanylate cyclase/phosphodiesterase [Pseudanabaena sp. PCC 6802]|uniref:putative bifunctional diguanylate cyclase/phosphodiesterase n=1 Tax=Pseudanabaena sp. PCC 6802 TaxID=118173 RepID=UPI0003490B79|nr:EAL domain-containing protein [Pseudanabaena sp. PCC 6802]